MYCCLHKHQGDILGSLLLYMYFRFMQFPPRSSGYRFLTLSTFLWFLFGFSQSQVKREREGYRWFDLQTELPQTTWPLYDLKIVLSNAWAIANGQANKHTKGSSRMFDWVHCRSFVNRTFDWQKFIVSSIGFINRTFGVRLGSITEQFD